MRERDQICNEARASEAGFSTLEAVIAVGILALCVLPLMDFQQTVADGAMRLSRSSAMIGATEQAESYLRALPVDEIADGEAALGPMTLTWQELARRETRPALSDSGAAGRFDLALVLIAYEVRGEGKLLGRGKVERLVWLPNAPFLDQEFSGG
jgi:Tfp pilus assembly protein PilV